MRGSRLEVERERERELIESRRTGLKKKCIKTAPNSVEGESEVVFSLAFVCAIN